MAYMGQNLENTWQKPLRPEQEAKDMSRATSQMQGAKATIKPKEVYKCAQGVKILERTPQDAVVATSASKPDVLLLKHQPLGAGMHAPVVVPDSKIEVTAEPVEKVERVEKAEPVEVTPAEPVEVTPVESVEVTPVESVKVSPVVRDTLSSKSKTKRGKAPSATAQAAAEAMQLLKDLDVLKKVKEFNARQHVDDDSAEDDFVFDHDGDNGDDDDNDSLNGMHVVRGDREHAASNFEAWDDLPEDDAFELDYDEPDFGEDFDHSELSGSVDQVQFQGDSYKGHGLDADEADDSGDDGYVLPDDSALGYSLDEDNEEDEDEGATPDALGGAIETSGAKAASTSSSRALVSAGRVSGGNTIGAFIKAVQQVPMLTQEEEQALARRLKDDDDIEAARRLVMSHLRLVVSIARGFNGYGLPLLDLIQEGNIGLMKAVRHFDPDEGVRLAAFAVHWIKSEIHEYVIRNWRMVKVATTKAQRRLFFKLRQSKTHLGWMSNQERQQLADMLGVTPHEVAVMETRMSGSDIGFDLDEGDDDKGMAVTKSPSSYLEDENSNFAQVLENNDYSNWEATKLYEALNTLDTRSRYIIKRRWLDEDKATLQELSGELKVSIERVRQLENNAMKKLKSMLLSKGVNAVEDVDSGNSAEPLRLPHIPTPALTYKPNAVATATAVASLPSTAGGVGVAVSPKKASKATKTKTVKATKSSKTVKVAKTTKRSPAIAPSEPTTVKARIAGAAKAARAKSATQAKSTVQAKTN